MTARHKDATAYDLTKATAAARSLVAALQTDDDALRHDMVEGETSLFEAVAAAIAEIDECDIIAAGCEAKIAECNSRKARVERRADKMRGLIEQALVIAEIPTMKLPTATITVKQVPPKPLYADESLIPAAYWKQPDPVLDRAAVNAAFKAGTDIPGVVATNGGTSLQIRRA